MPLSPQDDEFSGASLDPKWTFFQTPFATGSYSLVSDPGNIALNVPVEARWVGASGHQQIKNGIGVRQVLPDAEFWVELGIKQVGAFDSDHEVGLFVADSEDFAGGQHSFIAISKRFFGGVSQLRVRQVKTTLSPAGYVENASTIISFTDDTNIILRLQFVNGQWRAFYRREEESAFIDTGFAYSDAGFVPVGSAGWRMGAQAVAHFDTLDSSPAFNAVVNYFHYRKLQPVATLGDVRLRITNVQTTHGDVLLAVKNYPPVSVFEARQHFEAPTVSLSWANPAAPGYVETKIVRKEGSHPKSVSDGTLILTTSSLASHEDGPIQSRARQFYSAFAVHTDKTTFPVRTETMPVFVSLYKNAGARFSRKYRGGVWSLLYSLSKAISELADKDMAEAMAQFNLNTATDFFLDLWGKLFGARRFPSETDRVFSERVLARVLSPRTVPATIRAEVLKVAGVVYCEIDDATSGSMFVGHSFIGHAGSVETQTRADTIEALFTENPFFFTVRVRVKQGTNLAQIVKTVEDNKAAGTRFAVEILETVS